MGLARRGQQPPLCSPEDHRDRQEEGPEPGRCRRGGRRETQRVWEEGKEGTGEGDWEEGGRELEREDGWREERRERGEESSMDRRREKLRKTRS